jgi:hypothetical protein
MASYYDELMDKYYKTRNEQAKINKKLIEIEDKLTSKTIDFEMFEQIKILYKELAQTNDTLITLSREILDEVEKS